jgi:hypothetical protein
MNWDLLLFALMMVESNGDCSAVGDDGKALGCLQIHACVVEDVNRIYGTSYDWHVDSKYQSSSCKIAKKYLVYYGAHREGRTGLKATYEAYARIWNGGPKGNTKSKTDNYWNKVKAVIEKELGRELKKGE